MIVIRNARILANAKERKTAVRYQVVVTPAIATVQLTPMVVIMVKHLNVHSSYRVTIQVIFKIQPATYMKASKFNSFFKYDGTDVGYNSFTQEFIILDPLLFDLYLVGEKKGDFSELEAIHKDYYHFLVQQGFLVADELDEFEKTKELAYKIDNDDTLFHLIVNPTMNCNFKCWYCYETHIKDSKMDEKTISATISLIKNIATTQKKFKNVSSFFFWR